ncbi:hypothetical protein [Sphingobacterium thalpophilum]|uniref:Uncharacterized protein n=1 Tax=Sphingobacterium thalpophilum TaxID=259 RepID=A0A4U9UPC2_9SPHI|nr:hypothetical protein [Sphingobacterium thalpophilum]VTR34687.1 Uncharacterised protein [Sphingobacterium thalpophilum]
MKKVIHKIGRALQVVLSAPVKLPGKVPAFLKYLAIGLGIMETVIDEDPPISGSEKADQRPEDQENLQKEPEQDVNRTSLAEKGMEHETQ